LINAPAVISLQTFVPEAGDSLEEFLEAFPTVSREQAIAALESRERL
jgi:uncharacterized protein (DUF433 family)